MVLYNTRVQKIRLTQRVHGFVSNASSPGFVYPKNVEIKILMARIADFVAHGSELVRSLARLHSEREGIPG